MNLASQASAVQEFNVSVFFDSKVRMLPDTVSRSQLKHWCKGAFVGISRLRVVRATGKAVLMNEMIGMTAPRQWRRPPALSSRALA